jgi:DNA-directed RNA polymerase specialized sigma24 family protein
MAVAVTIKQASDALARLDAESRALLDLYLRRGMRDEEIAGVLRVDPSEVQRRVNELLDRMADELGLEERDERWELRATLPDLPPDAWQG